MLSSHNYIAGQWRTNPWPVVEDWPWCRTTDAGLTQPNTRKKDVARLTFFLHSGIYLLFHHQQYGCEDVFFQNPQSMCVWIWGCVLFQQQQAVNVRVFWFPHPTVWTWRCIVSVGVRVYPFPLPAGVDVCVPVHNQKCKHDVVSLSTTSSVYVRLYLWQLSTV